MANKMFDQMNYELLVSSSINERTIFGFLSQLSPLYFCVAGCSSQLEMIIMIVFVCG